MDQSVREKDTSAPSCDMAGYEKFAAPGVQHKLLASRTGSWKVRSKFWGEGDNPPMESSGTCERKMILGGRYLQEDFVGEMMGGPFTGMGITGYDNSANKYIATWIDSMSTGIYSFEGSGSEDGKTVTMEGHFTDPVKGKIDWQTVTRIVDDKTELFDMHMTSKSGKEEKCEMIYTRK